MSRVIFVPQYPTKCRYQEWWFTEFPKQFLKYFDEVVTLGESYVKDVEKSRGSELMFSPIQEAIDFEARQISEFNNMDIRENDVLFLADLSFPGLFSSVLYHGVCIDKYAFCHATSLNKQDYFETNRYSKYSVETGHARLFDKVFVGSEYHKNKLDWDNVEVVGLPSPPVIKPIDCKKTIDIVSVARPLSQKIDLDIERKVEERFGKIDRRMFDNWDDYSRFLSEAKILLISSKEDTFNYTIMDALLCKCFPVAPVRVCFPEILRPMYLYWDKDSLFRKIEKILDGRIPFTPKMECQDLVDNFYENICREMLD